MTYLNVIMPVGSDPQAREKKLAIRMASEKFGVEPRFPQHAEVRDSFDIGAALESLQGAQIVLADLSLERPSCYYELGLAEALGRPVFLVAQEGTDIHQTASRSSVRFYRDLAGLETEVREILTIAMESANVG